MDNRAIGVFDSGIGGLTVVKELNKILPNESIIYLGDTARVPYGDRSKETITKFSLECAKFLEEKNIKALVIACNTVSAIAIEEIKKRLNVEVIGVILPGSEMAIKTTKNKRIGIIGTSATINSGAYENSIKKLDDGVEIFSKACPLFVPIIENSQQDSDLAKTTIEYYLKDLTDREIDTIVMGCTHYPILENSIKSIVKDDIELINPAKETAEIVKNYLERKNLLNEKNANFEFFVTDNRKKFENSIKNILDLKEYEIKEVEI